MEYETTITLLKENVKIRELMSLKCYIIAVEYLNRQYERLYNSIDLKEYTLSEIENLDGF